MKQKPKFIRESQLPLGQTWEWPGTHSVSRGCPCACLCQSPNGKTALPWSPGRTSARLQTPAPQSPRWKHAACCGGGNGQEGREEGGGEGAGYGATVQWFTYTFTPPNLLFLAHQIKCHSAFTKWNPRPDGRGRLPPSGSDVRPGLTWKRARLRSTLAQPHARLCQRQE